MPRLLGCLGKEPNFMPNGSSDLHQIARGWEASREIYTRPFLPGQVRCGFCIWWSQPEGDQDGSGTE